MTTSDENLQIILHDKIRTIFVNFVALNHFGSRVTKEHRITTQNSVQQPLPLTEQNTRTNRRTTMPSASVYLSALQQYLYFETNWLIMRHI